MHEHRFKTTCMRPITVLLWITSFKNEGTLPSYGGVEMYWIIMCAFWFPMCLCGRVSEFYLLEGIELPYILYCKCQ